MADRGQPGRLGATGAGNGAGSPPDVGAQLLALAPPGGRLLVLHGPAAADAVAGVTGDDTCDVRALGAEPPHHLTPYDGVALVVDDRLELRAAASSLPRLPEVTVVASLLTAESRPAHLLPGADWPSVTDLEARQLPRGGALTVARLDAPISATTVLRQLARLAAPSGRVTALRPPVPAPAPPGGAHPDSFAGPLDEGVLNPIGFDPVPTEEVALLAADGAAGLRLEHVSAVDPLDPGCGATGRVVSALRAHRAVRVRWTGATHLAGLSRTVAGLAMAGVPLVSEGSAPPVAKALLGRDLHEVLTNPPDLTDDLRREEHSIRLRRAALLAHSGPAWRQRGGQATEHPPRRFPTCSVVLATRRPEQLDFALRQIVRQRGVTLEVVVVAHGFEVDPSRVRQRLGAVPGHALSVPADVVFGDVLTRGARASSGDLVVKMDDDDWYGPEFLLDLLLAREYSGADLVGTTAEMVYLHQVDRTVRRRTVSDSSERFAKFVAGGSMCLPRDLLDSLGGFRPVRRFVDHQLLEAALNAGATVYRGHGLGYLLRRRSEGHTWDPGVGFFLSGDHVASQWPGFSPSRLLEVDLVDRPAGTLESPS